MMSNDKLYNSVGGYNVSDLGVSNAVNMFGVCGVCAKYYKESDWRLCIVLSLILSIILGLLITVNSNIFIILALA